MDAAAVRRRVARHRSAAGPHGAPGPGGYVVPREHPSGTTVLVLGILSLVVCPLTGIFAITTGNRALREIDADPQAWTNRQTVVVGRVLGIVGVAVVGGILALYLLFGGAGGRAPAEQLGG